MNKVYHIYGRGECLYHSLSEEEFHNIWNQLNNMVGLMKTDYSVDDLSYEELSHVNYNDNGPSGCPSY